LIDFALPSLSIVCRRFLHKSRRKVEILLQHRELLKAILTGQWSLSNSIAVEPLTSASCRRYHISMVTGEDSAMRASKRIWPYIRIVLFIPASSLAAGVLAYFMRLSAPVSGGNGFWDVLRGYAPFWPGTYGVRHIPSLILSVAVLLLLAVSQGARKPVVTLFQIRVILLVLLALLTIPVKIFVVIALMDSTAKAVTPLFIYADLDIFLVFLMTFLPLYRKPGVQLV
jgi:hypothetical protein